MRLMFLNLFVERRALLIPFVFLRIQPELLCVSNKFFDAAQCYEMVVNVVQYCRSLKWPRPLLCRVEVVRATKSSHFSDARISCYIYVYMLHIAFRANGFMNKVLLRCFVNHLIKYFLQD